MVNLISISKQVKLFIINLVRDHAGLSKVFNSQSGGLFRFNGPTKPDSSGRLVYRIILR